MCFPGVLRAGRPPPFSFGVRQPLTSVLKRPLLLGAGSVSITAGSPGMSHPIHLILSAGTRIVTRNDANRIGGGQLIAAGAVAIIIDSPSDGQHAYKVRCNDGAEAMLRRNEFSILRGCFENG